MNKKRLSQIESILISKKEDIRASDLINKYNLDRVRNTYDFDQNKNLDIQEVSYDSSHISKIKQGKNFKRLNSCYNPASVSYTIKETSGN